MPLPPDLFPPKEDDPPFSLPPAPIPRVSTRPVVTEAGPVIPEIQQMQSALGALEARIKSSAAAEILSRVTALEVGLIRLDGAVSRVLERLDRITQLLDHPVVPGKPATPRKSRGKAPTVPITGEVPPGETANLEAVK